ncbi:MAG: ATP-binding cassette domain-containing protein [Candidatus Gastranaerophilales bacterium]|nr:ATP-binding cassette domain-containing protein [Candidatus Gastranaerophilales bacterium]
MNREELLEKFRDNNFVKNYKRMWPFVKPYAFRALVAMLICIPLGSLDAIIALSLKPYMDVVLVEKQVGSSPFLIPLLIILFTTVQGTLNYLADYMNVWVGMKITLDLKRKLYAKLMALETAYFDNQTSGDVLFRFNQDAEIACNGLLSNLKLFVSRIFSSISLVGVLIWNSWHLAIIAITVLGAALAPLAFVRKRIESAVGENVVAVTKVMTTYNETFAGNKTVASYNLQPKLTNSFSVLLQDLFSLMMKITKRTAIISPITYFIISLGIAAVIGFSNYLIVNKVITSGNFVSFITALVMLYQPIKSLSNNLKDVQFSFMAIERVYDILERVPAVQDCEDPIELKNIGSGVKFDDVYFEYGNGVPVLKGISFSAKANQTIAIVGNSGGGKTTLVNLIPRFYDVCGGSISIDGIDVRNYSLKSLRDNIAVVFQDNFLFSGTIRENILLGKQDATEEEINAALKCAFLDEFVAGLENGLDTFIGERGTLLSGGQKQRVAIARAFLKNAPIVILDEATSALDNKAEAVVQKAIDNLMASRTVFVIAHRLSTVQNADRIMVVNDGNIVESGTHEELLRADNGAYKALYMAQFKAQPAMQS